MTGEEIDKSQGIAMARLWGFLAQGFKFPSLPRASDYICKLGLSLLVLVRVESDPVRNQKQPDTEGRAALRKAQLCPRSCLTESEAHGSTSLSVQQALGSLLSLASPALLPCGHWRTSSGLQAHVANLG